MKNFFVAIILLLLLTSCISTKQSTYFQGETQKKTDLYKLNNQPYRFQVNDILYINLKASNPEIVTLFKNNENTQQAGANVGNLYFTGYSVDRHGNINIPYLGDINVLGYTEKEVKDKIESQLGTYLKNPKDVYVTVKLAGVTVTVTGEVGSPGTLNLSQNQVSIIDAIANAGEITQFGNKEKVLLIRKTLDGVKKFEIDLTSMDVFQSENFYVQPNDIIYVAPLKQKAWGTGTTGLQTFSTIVTVLSFLASTVLLVKNL